MEAAAASGKINTLDIYLEGNMGEAEVINGKKVKAICCRDLISANICKSLCCFGEMYNGKGNFCPIECIDPTVYYVEVADA